MPRPIVAAIDLTALESNLNIVRSYAPKARVWSVTKANGYGHGLQSVWQGLQKTDGFAVLDINEAIILREKGWCGPILLLEGFFKSDDLKEVDHYRLTTTIHSEWQIDAVKSITPCMPLNVYIKLNSGMNRLGFNDRALINAWNVLSKMKQVSKITLMTHFSSAYISKNKSTDEQMKIVAQISNKLVGPQCLANSAAVLWQPKTHGQWIRPGIILYGASPSGKWKDISNSGFQPVMTLQSEIIAVQMVSAGKSIGYGSNYVDKTQRIGIVACGYADGYPRKSLTAIPVCVDGIKTRTLGVASMDMLTVDLGPCPQANVGSKVELWGKNIKIDDVANAAGTLGYELMSSLSSRVKIKIFSKL